HCFVHSVGQLEDDNAWLQAIIEGKLDETKIQSDRLINEVKPLSGLPSAASLIIWLIVSHHRLPLPKCRDLCDKQADISNDNLQSLLGRITSEWGYENRFDDFEQLKQQCFQFPQGLLTNSDIWLSKLKQWANDLKHH